MIECRICGREFPNMASLAGHIRGHSQSSFQLMLVEALNRQNELLEEILSELKSMHRLLEGLSFTETKIEKVTARTVTPSHKKTGEKKEESNLPSYLRDNPWVEILSKRSE
jgi:hypothetical protein